MRVNVQLDAALREEVQEYTARQGVSLSQFLRVAAKERIERLRRMERDDLLRLGYLEMGDENRRTSEEFEPVDLEGWE